MKFANEKAKDESPAALPMKLKQPVMYAHKLERFSGTSCADQ
jgi:hypothetical protein